jgi:predicted nucleic acid-binding protein
MVLLDTSFLITLVDKKRPHHALANQYYQLLVKEQYPLFLSTIVATEFAHGQPITDLPLANLRIIPFNLLHAVESARIFRLLKPQNTNDITNDSAKESRVVVINDVKLIGQALIEKIPYVLTEDAVTLFKFCERLRMEHRLAIKAIKLVDGFTPGALGLGEQVDLDIPPP